MLNDGFRDGIFSCLAEIGGFPLDFLILMVYSRPPYTTAFDVVIQAMQLK